MTQSRRDPMPGDPMRAGSRADRPSDADRSADAAAAASSESALGRRQFVAGMTGLGLSAAVGGAPAMVDAMGSTIGPGSELEQALAPIDGELMGQMCKLAPEKGEGPFYLDLDLLRSDITEDRLGLPASFFIEIQRADTCEPIPDVVVDVWQCDADGVYSGVKGDPNTFLRGLQVTGANGRVRFETIYPGWYPGRTAHIHLKAYMGATEFITTQLFFPQNVTDLVYTTVPPYDANGLADTPNADDQAYDRQTQMRVLRNPDGSMSVWMGIRIAVAL